MARGREELYARTGQAAAGDEGIGIFELQEEDSEWLIALQGLDLPDLAVNQLLIEALGAQVGGAPRKGDLFRAFDVVRDGPVERVDQEILQEGTAIAGEREREFQIVRRGHGIAS